MSVFAALGPIKFETNAANMNATKAGMPNAFQSKLKATITPLSRMGQADAVQHNGREARNMSISYEFNAHISGPNIEEFAIQLDQYLGDGTVLPLIQGSGRRWGNFLVASHDYEVVKTAQGIPLQIKGTIGLMEYVK